METLEQTLKNTHDWSRERIHVLCKEEKMQAAEESIWELELL